MKSIFNSTNAPYIVGGALAIVVSSIPPVWLIFNELLPYKFSTGYLPICASILSCLAIAILIESVIDKNNTISEQKDKEDSLNNQLYHQKCTELHLSNQLFATSKELSDLQTQQVNNQIPRSDLNGANIDSHRVIFTHYQPQR